MVPSILWDKSRNPTRYVSQSLGLEEGQLQTLFTLSSGTVASPAPIVIIYTDSVVTDEGGEILGNV